MPILAYLDPVTGSALLQILLGAAAAVGLGWQYLRRWFRNLTSYLADRGSSGPPVDDTPTVDRSPSEMTIGDTGL